MLMDNGLVSRAKAMSSDVVLRPDTLEGLKHEVGYIRSRAAISHELQHGN